MPDRSTNRENNEGLLKARVHELENRLADAEETLRAIREGEVDALMVGEKVYALEGADHSYRILVEQMREGTITLNPEGLILYSNAQFAAMIRTPLEQVIGAHIRRFVPDDDWNIFAGLLEAGVAWQSRGEVMLRTSNGTPVASQISLSRLEGHGVANVCAVIMDLTERRRNEEIVREEQLSRSILDQAAESIILIDSQGTIIRASESARHLAGQAVLLRAFDNTFPLLTGGRSTIAPERIDAASLVARVGSGKPLRGLQVTFSGPQKKSLSLLLTAGALWSASRELLGCVITLTDITERTSAEEALSRQADELTRANRDLQQFAYSASHDLQEPIRWLVTYNQLLRQQYIGKLDAQAELFMDFMLQSAQRVEGLLQDLLAYTQAGEAELAREGGGDAERALSNALCVLEARINENQATVTRGALPGLKVHEVHLQQLFLNLVGNALKYRSEAPPVIRITAEPENESMWKIMVEDNGIGIEPQYQSQIFGLFKRLHGRSKYPGNGLGLAICQKIVERYGGRIWVESVKPSGSRFCFTLPGRSDSSREKL